MDAVVLIKVDSTLKAGDKIKCYDISDRDPKYAISVTA